MLIHNINTVLTLIYEICWSVYVIKYRCKYNMVKCICYKIQVHNFCDLLPNVHMNTPLSTPYDLFTLQQPFSSNSKCLARPFSSSAVSVDFSPWARKQKNHWTDCFQTWQVYSLLNFCICSLQIANSLQITTKFGTFGVVHLRQMTSREMTFNLRPLINWAAGTWIAWI